MLRISMKREKCQVYNVASHMGLAPYVTPNKWVECIVIGFGAAL